MQVYVFRWSIKLKVILKMINPWSGFFFIGNQILQSISSWFYMVCFLWVSVVERWFSLYQIIKSILLQSIFPIFHRLAMFNFFSFLFLICLWGFHVIYCIDASGFGNARENTLPCSQVRFGDEFKTQSGFLKKLMLGLYIFLLYVMVVFFQQVVPEFFFLIYICVCVLKLNLECMTSIISLILLWSLHTIYF